jgi:hypothetical protein
VSSIVICLPNNFSVEQAENHCPHSFLSRWFANNPQGMRTTDFLEVECTRRALIRFSSGPYFEEPHRGLRFARAHDRIICGGLRAATEVMTTPSDHPIILTPTEVLTPVQRPSRKRQAFAFLIAAVSDFFSFWTVLAPPMQWVIDLVTALLLFLILGRRWAILPGLVAEAIPGMGIFPVWVLVVLSMIVYDDIKARKN